MGICSLSVASIIIPCHLWILAFSSFCNTSLAPTVTYPCYLVFDGILSWESEVSCTWRSGIFHDMTGFLFGGLGFLYFACSLLLFGFSVSFLALLRFCFFFNKKFSTSDRQQTYSCMFKTAKSSCSPPLALHWSTPWSMHWTPENYPFPIKARLLQATGVLQPVFVHFKMTFQPVFFVSFSSHCLWWLLCNYIVLSSIKEKIPTPQSK